MIVQSTTATVPDAQIPRHWRPFLRTVWLAIVLFLVTIEVASLPPYFYQLREECAEPACPILALSPEEVMALQDIGLSLDFYAGIQVGMEILSVILLIPLAGLIFWRQSHTWVGMVVSFALATIAVGDYTIMPELIPDLRWAFVLFDVLVAILFVLLFFVFPDGRFVPPWTLWIVVSLFGVIMIEQLRLILAGAAPSISIFDNVLWLCGVLAGVYAQVYRYRFVSTPTQRQQTKWILYGLISVSFATIIWTLLGEMFPIQTGPAGLGFKFSYGLLVILFSAFPVSITFSILRYRLWDIDLVIQRTLQYTLLTALLALVYFGSVVLLQSMVENLTGGQSPVVIVLSTLAIAALFNPLRIRVQDFIDHRFYRKKYNAEQELAQFAAAARDEVDMEKLTSALLGVVEETMQPERTSLWIKQ